MTLRMPVSSPGLTYVGLALTMAATLLLEILDSRVQTDDSDHAELHSVDLAVVDLEIERARTLDWVISRVALRTGTEHLAAPAHSAGPPL